MSLVVGNENYDWRELEATTEYKNGEAGNLANVVLSHLRTCFFFSVFGPGYDKDHPTIRNFWSVFHDLSLNDKKKFLLFLTGCDRIPILGMKSLKLVIQKAGDENFLPVAHTCFNTLDLPNYATREKLRYKLMKAIQHTEGFGLA